MKKRKRHSPEQIIKKLRDADAMLAAAKDGLLAAVFCFDYSPFPLNFLICRWIVDFEREVFASISRMEAPPE